MKNNIVEPDYSDAIESAFHKFDLDCSVDYAIQGPTFTRYLVSPKPGTAVSLIIKKAEEIAVAIPVDGARIAGPIAELAAIAVEIPNKQREIIRFDEMLQAINESKYQLPVALGRTPEGFDYLFDLATAPNVLIGGIEGSGNTMVLHSIICSLYCSQNADDIRFILVQPGRGDLELYRGFECLERPVITKVEDVFTMLEEMVVEAERRMRIFAEYKVHRLKDLNEKRQDKKPYIIFIFDEIADIVAYDGKRFDYLIKRLTAVGRFLGFHFILSTSRPHPDVISPVVWSNMPTRIALKLSDQYYSQFVLGFTGAEKLLGKGDMLYFYNATVHIPVRIQGVFCGPDEFMT